MAEQAPGTLRMSPVAAAPPYRDVPPGYVARSTIDLSKGAVMGWLTIASFALLPVVAVLFLLAAGALRSDLDLTNLTIGVTVRSADGPIILQLAPAMGFILGILLSVVPHELVHGIFFRFFTGERARYGWKLIYFYASAPGWYLSRGQYLAVGLAPLVVISLVGLALLPIVPAVVLPGLLAILIFNAAGAVGDLFIIGWLLVQPRGSVVEDNGLSMTIYAPAKGVAA